MGAEQATKLKRSSGFAADTTDDYCNTSQYCYSSMALTTSFGDRNYGIQAGIVNGDVKPTIYLPPGKLRGRPSEARTKR
jgi:hypothetical protein